MNKAYRTVYNEKTGTFVAVAENVKARGKRASSRIRTAGTLVIAAAVGMLSMGGALADVVVDEAGNTIDFTTPGGAINFQGGGSITGLTHLTVEGALTVSSLTVGGKSIVTSDELSDVIDNVTTNTTDIATNTTNISGLDERVTANESQIATNTANIDTNTSSISGLDERVTTNEGDIATNTTKIGALDTQVTANAQAITTNQDAIEQIFTNLGVQAGTEGAGVKYFRANSKAGDAEALGEDSVAIGPEAKAEGESSFAAGDGAEALEEASFAAGKGASADGKSTVALGDGATVKKPANGGDPLAAIAIGKDSISSEAGSVALGHKATASGERATALGAEARALGAGSVALGGAAAGGARSVAAGVGAQAWTNDSIVFGSNAGVGTGSEENDSKQRHSHIIIGKNAGNNIDGNEAIAIGVGAGSNTTESMQIAIGGAAGMYLKGERNVSIGHKANSFESTEEIKHATALGTQTIAMTNAVAVGYNANATTNAVAIGSGSVAQDESIALGHNSKAVQSSGAGWLTGKSFTGGTVSVGNADAGLTRRITNVEDGAAGYDAVNVRQLEKLKEQLGSFTPESGGNVNYNVGGTISVEAAQADGQAVNLAQMNTAIADSKPKYISINPNGDNANEDGSGALGANSTNSMAIGHAAKVENAERATAVGYLVLAKAADATAIGSGSTVDDASGVAIGHGAYSRGTNSLALGTDAQTEPQATGATSNDAIAIGTKSRATNDKATAIGHTATASGLQASALGYFSNASGTNAMAFGTRASASGLNSQASGTNAVASATDSQASGTNAKAYASRGIAMGEGARSGESDPHVDDKEKNRDSIAIGTQSVAEMNSSMAMGNQAQATANYAQASGFKAEAKGESSIAYGTGAVSSAENAIAQGTGADASGENAIAQGTGARALFNDSIAFGQNAVSSAEKALAFGAGATAGNTNSVAIGAGAKAESNRSVALGDGAVSTGAVGTSNATVGTLTYGGFAGSNPIATVSVGTGTEKRTITNVAAGRISASSTDAINGSQLFATNTVLGNVANTTKNILGGDASLNPNGSLTMNNIGDTGKNNIHDAIKSSRTEVLKGTNIASATKTQGADGHDIYTINADGASVSAGDGLAVTAGAKDANNVTNYKVDLSQTTKDSLDKADTALQSIVTQIDGADVKTLNQGSNNANFITGDNIELTADAGGIRIATAKNVVFDSVGSSTVNVTDTITVAGNTTINNTGITTNSITSDEMIVNHGGTAINVGEKLDSGITFVGDDSNKTEQKLGSELAIAGDGNISTSVENGKVQVNLNKNLDLGTDGSLAIGDTLVNNDGLTVEDATGNKNVTNAAGTTLTDAAGNTNVSTATGTVVSDSAGNNTTVGAGTIAVSDGAHSTTIGSTQVVVGGNNSITLDGDKGTIGGLTNTTFDPDNFTTGQAATEDQLKSVSDVANAGWNVSTNGDATGENVAPGAKVDFSNTDGNIAIAQTGTNLTFDLNKDLDLGTDGSLAIGDTLVNNDGLTVEDATGNKNVTNAAGTTLTDAAGNTNVSTATGTVVSDSAGNNTTVGAGTIAVSDGAHSTTIGSTQVVVGGNNSITLDGDKGTIGGLTNTTFDPDNFTTGQAATEDQLKSVSDVANAGWNVSTNGDATGENVAPGAKVDFSNTDGNIAIAQTGTNLTFDLNKDLDLGTDGSLAIGDTLVNNDGLTVEDATGNKNVTNAAGTTLTDAAGNTNVSTATGTVVSDSAGNNTTVGAGTIAVSDGAHSTTIGSTQVVVGGNNSITLDGDKGTIGGLTNTTFDPDNFTTGQAATEDQLKSVSDVANAGWNVSTNGDATGENVAPGAKVDFSNTDGNIAIAQTGTDLTFNLRKDLDLGTDGSLTIGDTLVNNDGLTIEDAAGNKTETTVAGTVVSNAAGDASTSIGAGTINVAGGSNTIVIDGNAGTIGGLTNTTFDPDNFTTGQAATEDQLKSVSDVANAGWNVSTNGDATGENVAPGAKVDFSNTDRNIVIDQTGTDLTFNLRKDLNLGTDGSLTIGATVVNNDGLTIGDTVVNNDGLTVEDATGNKNVTNAVGTTLTDAAGNTNVSTATGTVVSDSAGNNTTVGAGTIAVSDGAHSTTIGSTQVVVGGNNSITLDGDKGTIGGLTNTTFDPDNFTTGQAATEDQLKSVSDVANAGWNVSTNGDATGENVAPGAKVDFSNTDGNIAIAQTGTNLTFDLNKDLDLGTDGSLAIGDTLVNNDGLTVEDATGNKNVTNAAGTTLTDAAGNTNVSTATGTVVSDSAGNNTTVGAGTIAVSDGAHSTTIGSTQVVVGGNNSITLDGDKGTIGGLTNTTFDPDNFTTGQAATEDQLKSVSDVANAGWNVSTNGDATGENVAPGAKVDFSNTDGNIAIAQTGTDLTFNLRKDLDLGTDGSLTIGDTLVNNDGLTVEDAAGNKTETTTAGTTVTNAAGDSTVLGAGLISVADAAGTTVIGGDQISIGGANPILVSGNTGTISGLTNVTVDYPGFGTAGRAATEEQLKPITDFVGLDSAGQFTYNGNTYNSLKDAFEDMHWNVEAPIQPDSGSAGAGSSGTTSSGGASSNGSSGSGATNPDETPVYGGNTVGFIGDGNIVVSKTDRANSSGADINVALAKDIKVDSITSVKVTADEIVINNGGPIINDKGIDMSGNRITNMAAGVADTDAVNVGQLHEATGQLQGQVNNLRHDLRRQDKKLSAGVAAAMATAALPQAYLPGKTMMSLAAGTWAGEQGMALGFSGITDNGKWIYKVSGNSTSRGEYGAAVGIGYQW